ncbi:MAG: hypothetical protein IJB97_05735, partial [Clostridia bacterium]|nr:hypothetical protein [Clostridia bacterium]
MNKKILRSLTALTLCGVTAFVSLIVADDRAETATAEKTGNHVRIIKDTDEYIVKDGSTEYQ